MVGYEKDETLSPNQKLVASLLSGIITRSMTNPLDVIKVRAQLQKKKQFQGKWFKVSRTIYRETGLKSFWRGHMIGQIHSVTAVSVQFYVYEVSTRFVELSQLNNKVKKQLYFCCGILAGCVSATVMNPLDVIKTRQMINKSKTGILEKARSVYATGGILAFYEGLSAALIQIGPQVGISFATFRFTQRLVLDLMNDCDVTATEKCHSQTSKNAAKIATSSAIAGGVAAMVSKTLTYPFELTKKRMQIRSHRDVDGTMFKCESLIPCLIESFRQEGLQGLFRGYKIAVYKATFTGICAFTTYEIMCHITRKILERVDGKQPSSHVTNVVTGACSDKTDLSSTDTSTNSVNKNTCSDITEGKTNISSSDEKPSILNGTSVVNGPNVTDQKTNGIASSSNGKNSISNETNLNPDGKNPTPRGTNLNPDGKNPTSRGKNLNPDGKKPTPHGTNFNPDGKNPTSRGTNLSTNGPSTISNEKSPGTTER